MLIHNATGDVTEFLRSKKKTADNSIRIRLIDFCTQKERVTARMRVGEKVGSMRMRKFNKSMFLCVEVRAPFCWSRFRPPPFPLHRPSVYTLYQIINKSNLYEDVTFSSRSFVRRLLTNIKCAPFVRMMTQNES